MSERLSAEILIGGDVQADQVEGLCDAICCEGASLEWGDRRFDPQSEEELLEALVEIEGVSLLRLQNEQASWGQFDGLEAWLVECNLPFTRRSEATDCYDAELVEFRPGGEVMSIATDTAGHPQISIEPVRQAWQLVKRAQQTLSEGGEVATLIAEAAELLGSKLPPEVPPLPAFRIKAN